jgi:hypothetical protein
LKKTNEKKTFLFFLFQKNDRHSEDTHFVQQPRWLEHFNQSYFNRHSVNLYGFNHLFGYCGLLNLYINSNEKHSPLHSLWCEFPRLRLVSVWIILHVLEITKSFCLTLTLTLSLSLSFIFLSFNILFKFCVF